MFEVNLNKLMDNLASEDYTIQVKALEEASNILSLLTEQSVKALMVSDNPYLIAERLLNFGTRIIPPLEKFVGDENEENSEKKVLGSIILLKLGSRKGLENVIKELKEKGKNEYLAAKILIEAKIPEGADLIVERLRKFSLEELTDINKSTYISNLLSYLEELSVPLPSDLIECFESIKNSETYKYYSVYL